jgi:hypothetical protein
MKKLEASTNMETAKIMDAHMMCEVCGNVGYLGNDCSRQGKKPASSTMAMLMVNSCIKVRLDLQADKSPVVVKGPFLPRVVNPRYRIRGTNV